MRHQLHRAIGGNHLPPVQEITLQQTADQGRAADLEQNMLGAQRESSLFIGIGEDLFHFLQCLGRHNKAHGSADGAFGVPSAASQTETVHSDGGNRAFLHFELDTGVDGTALIFRNRKNGAGDHLLQRSLGDMNSTAVIHLGQLRIILSAFCADGKGSISAADGNLKAFVHHHSHRPLGQTANDITKKSGRENAGTGFGDLCINMIGNGSFHIVAGELQIIFCIAENTFQNGQAALLSYGSACNIQALNQHTFFTGKTHIHFPFCLNNIDIYIYRYLRQ